MYVVPKKGLIVLDPESFQPIPEAGANVGGSAVHWERQRLAGDVEIYESAEAFAASQKTTSKPAKSGTET